MRSDLTVILTQAKVAYVVVDEPYALHYGTVKNVIRDCTRAQLNFKFLLLFAPIEYQIK